MKQRRPSLPYIIGAWAGLGLLMAARAWELSEALWILTPLVWLAYGIAGVSLCVLALWRARRGHWSRSLLVWAAVVPASLAALWVMVPRLEAAGSRRAFEQRLRALQPRYEAIVARLAQLPDSAERGAIDGIGYVVDAGPPLRVAFPQPGGIIDNWEGVVHDPTGVVAQAQGWSYADGQQTFTAPPAVVRLFGGDLVDCVPVEGPFYRCWFTYVTVLTSAYLTTR